MSTRHTPGPWRILSHRHDEDIYIEGADGIIATVYVDREGDVGAANARLIAAAPELLVVVKKLRHAINALEIDPVDAEYCSILEQADIAVAKVEGRS
jgi:hypothetical protein